MDSSLRNLSSPRVRFDLPIHKESIIQFIQEEGEASHAYRLNLVLKAISEGEPTDYLKWIKELKDNILFFNKKNEPLLLHLLGIEWYSKDENFVKLYEELILNLLTAHPLYLKLVLHSVISVFLKVSTEKESVTEEESKMLQNLHSLLRRINELIPMSWDTFYAILMNKFPYLQRPPCIILHYIENLLTICSYLPTKRHQILDCIIKRLIEIDVYCSKSMIEKYELEREEKNQVMGQEMELETSDIKVDQMALPLAHTLDIAMNCLFTFFKCFSHDGEKLNWENTKKLYKEMLTIFDMIVLPTQGSCHVQYLLFYICGLKQELSVGFLDYLWKKVQNPSVPPVLRQISAFYIGSFLSRAKYISINTVTGCFDLMCSWIHSYIDTHTSKDIEVHGTFHSVCQTIFYVFAFRSKELMEMNDGFRYIQSLNFDRIASCRLNPLRFCDKNIVQNFANIARNYQIAYVYPIIERNNRNLLYAGFRSQSEESTAGAMIPAFFPYDPYLLKRSKHWIESQYRVYNHGNKDEDLADFTDEEMNVDDEKSSYNQYNYSMSPGFKKNYIKICR
ncbi:RNA polymerase I-specific transcription initiation factor RRN3 [Caerostris darwini]|uniref:RNA polymerase I-specific transcription initiation factor RRN3 n=1 Tax=Caerostris darwini TaxID=1538125 RepID=A0AAV4X277_9ARAC|nr:RNA polymerase I-specific transcription initiation factor RRN3 [Caerostris darwini]